MQRSKLLKHVFDCFDFHDQPTNPRCNFLKYLPTGPQARRATETEERDRQLGEEGCLEWTFWRTIDQEGTLGSFFKCAFNRPLSHLQQNDVFKNLLTSIDFNALQAMELWDTFVTFHTCLEPRTLVPCCNSMMKHPILLVRTTNSGTCIGCELFNRTMFGFSLLQLSWNTFPSHQFPVSSSVIGCVPRTLYDQFRYHLPSVASINLLEAHVLHLHLKR